jgi:predicted RecB family nuclease
MAGVNPRGRGHGKASVGEAIMITDRTFFSFLNCQRKAFLQSAGMTGEQPDTDRVQIDLDRLYRRQAIGVLLGAYRPADVVVDPTSWEAIPGVPRVIVNATVGDNDLQAQLHAAEQIESKRGRRAATYAPVLFVRTNHLTRADKLLLAFQALALASVQGAIPSVGKVVHGACLKVLKLKVESLVGEVQQILGAIRAAQASPVARQLTLNGHCSACEYRVRCRQTAEAVDDLSLLRGLPLKEVEKHRARGITTVTQLSYSYRPGRRGKRRSGKARRHDHALQALAIREKKVYVLDSPAVPRTGMALYLDVEGVPDRDFYYLIGLVAVVDGASKSYSFWADDRDQVRANWQSCARLIEGFGDYTLYHYGRFELRFLDRMKGLADAEWAAAVDRIRDRSYNVLAAIYSHVYCPTYTNGLKDIGALLGAKWSAAGASGLQSLAWRLAWEARREESLKQELLKYNLEDCLALRTVTEFLQSLDIGEQHRAEEGRPPVASPEDLYPERGFRFGKPEFFCPELAYTNKCAYSDYQREKVCLRTSGALRQSQRRKQRAKKKRLRANQEIECEPPTACPACGATQVHRFGSKPVRKLVLDLKFNSSGVKRCVTSYTSARYRCWHCRKTFLAGSYNAAERVGQNLASWAIYCHVALCLSHEDVTLSLNDVFGFSFGYPILYRIKRLAAERHRPAYDRLKQKLRQGNLIHGDETKVQVQRGNGYVWAFTNLEEVVYVYTPTREGTVLDDILEGFTGVLVTDFYAAYDAVQCTQQKCLVHLARDINDDLFHNPFDEELKQLAQALVAVLKPIIDAIDRYGLKRHYLHKHKADVVRFFRRVLGMAHESEAARKYQKTLLQYREKLFVFLDHDGVPWNNNNAENALKRFASRRKIIGAAFGERGLRDYLVFLSIYQTCRNKHLSFLRFLRSGSQDLDAFAEAAGR